MIVYEHNLIKRGEIWFDAEPDRPVDVIEYMHRSAPVPDCRHVDFLTSLIDLRKTEDALFAAIRPEARRQIRRAAESDLRYEMIRPVPQEIVEDFHRAYYALAAAKKLPALSAKIIATYNDAGKLAISRVMAPGDAALTWHAYYIADGRAAQLHSIANFRDDKETRNLVGRAHRFHTWMDIKQCRDDGLITFDFGGVYSGTSNQELLRVNAFKEEFGGVASRDYICERAMTTRGRLYLFARNLAKSGMLNSLQAARGE